MRKLSFFKRLFNYGFNSGSEYQLEVGDIFISTMYCLSLDKDIVVECLVLGRTDNNVYLKILSTDYGEMKNHTTSIDELRHFIYLRNNLENR